MNAISTDYFLRVTGVPKEQLRLLVGNDKRITAAQAIALTKELKLSPAHVMRIFAH